MGGGRGGGGRRRRKKGWDEELGWRRKRKVWRRREPTLQGADKPVRAAFARGGGRWSGENNGV